MEAGEPGLQDGIGGIEPGAMFSWKATSDIKGEPANKVGYVVIDGQVIAIGEEGLEGSSDLWQLKRGQGPAIPRNPKRKGSKERQPTPGGTQRNVDGEHGKHPDGEHSRTTKKPGGHQGYPRSGR